MRTTLAVTLLCLPALVPVFAIGAQSARGSAASANAQRAASAALRIEEAKPGLGARAKVTGAAALGTAQAKVPTGIVDAGEIEEEDGKLIYSFIFKVPGKPGVDEVAVDALTGKVIGIEHETLEQLTKERKADSLAKAKAARGRGSS